VAFKEIETFSRVLAIALLVPYEQSRFDLFLDGKEWELSSPKVEYMHLSMVETPQLFLEKIEVTLLAGYYSHYKLIELQTKHITHAIC